MGDLLEIRGIAEIGGQQDGGIRKAEVDGDGTGQGAGVAADQNVALRVTPGVGQAERIEVPLHHQVGDEGLVLEGLVEEQKLFTLIQAHRRPRGRVGVGKKIEELLAVEAIGGDFLVDDPRRDAQLVCGLPGKGQASPATVAAVDVAVLATALAQRVDPATVLGAIGHGAQRKRVADRQVDGALEMAALAAIRQRVEIGFDLAVGAALEVRLVGDEAHGTAHGTGAEQRALRAAQRFDAVEVEEVEVRGKQRQRNHRLVQVHADLLLHARLVADDLTGGHAADGDLALARAEVLDGEAGDVARQILEREHVVAFYRLLGLGVDGERQVLHRGLTLGGGNQDFFNLGAGKLRQRRCHRDRQGRVLQVFHCGILTMEIVLVVVPDCSEGSPQPRVKTV